MSILRGYDTFEGPAYYGKTLNSEGISAVVIIGNRGIEIRTSDDETLAIWSIGRMKCNNKELPLRAYFMGKEWIAPQDDELRIALDSCMGILVKEETHSKKPSVNFKIDLKQLLMPILSILAIGFMFIIVVKLNLGSLAGPELSYELEQRIVKLNNLNTQYCGADDVKRIKKQLSYNDKNMNFDVVDNLGVDYARLPTGRLLIDLDYATHFSSIEDYRALISLNAQKKDAGEGLLYSLNMIEGIVFFFSGNLENDILLDIWNIFKNSDQLSANEAIKFAPMAVGNIKKIANLHGATYTSENPIKPLDQYIDPLPLTSLCN